MFVVVTRRIVKTNTGTTEKFAPRTRNEINLRVSGPFPTLRVAQKIAFKCLGVHTCLDAQVWSEARVREDYAKGYSMLGNDRWEALKEAVRLIDDAKTTEEVTA